MASRKQRKRPEGKRAKKKSDGTSRRGGKCAGCGRKTKSPKPELSALLCCGRKKNKKGREALARFFGNVDSYLLRRAEGFCVRYGISKRDAEEYVCEFYLRLLQKINKYDCSRDPLAWMAVMLRNLIISGGRRVSTGQKVARRAAVSEEEISEKDRPDNVAAAREEVRRVQEAIDRLPKMEKDAVKLHLKGMTNATIAKRLGWPIGTVGTRLLKGRQRIRVALGAAWVGKNGNGKELESDKVKGMRPSRTDRRK
jgi:RNA polymerase sigma-70 factor (ECF subfamily)